ncbi:GH3 auxin-responsive promoter [Isosphaera pallida ATCC 43644]|uniref:GH3 auxin-responsive promoter n=1 Tax=Isosphaera pallida (strain ATCC 43644 / DSM 9630 / IS1B) TaxID=575540 RepID=E8R4B6_ISOPI|nr:GH3 auxin-responsive promoter family protein [Isosphaera pallida]ADV62717.1 GH3 auxin-responsive promoter [Isosphaera pallida ATCC 43644]
MSNPLHLMTGFSAVRSAVNAGFHAYALGRAAHLDRQNAVQVQQRVLKRLVRRAGSTRFGQDHRFDQIDSVAGFQTRVPIRDFEALWNAYLKTGYPAARDLTWPGQVPYWALTSGTTLGNTKAIPVSRAMIKSNAKAAKTMIAHHMRQRPDSKLFHGKLFFLGGSTALERPAAGVAQGDLSAIAVLEAGEWIRPYSFPPLELALISDWDRKLALMAEHAVSEPITLVSGVPSWLLILFRRVLEVSGKGSLAEVWPGLEVVVHGGVKFDPYRPAFEAVLGNPAIRLQESYPASEGFFAYGDPDTGSLRLIVDHGIFYEFIPVDQLNSDHPQRHWLGNVELGVNYALVVSTCAGMWSHLVGDTVRFESLKPPRIVFTGRTKYSLSAFGEHLISEEIEAAIAHAAKANGLRVQDWHVGPVFAEPMGFHRYIIEFDHPSRPEAAVLDRFRLDLDADLQRRNADYAAHRDDRAGMPAPEIVVAPQGFFRDWMRSKGKLGGQHKVPRMDNSGQLTQEIVAFHEQRRSVVPS